jgi:accessory gene regulator B
MNIYQQTIEKCAQSLAQHMQGNRSNNQAIINYALQLVVFNTLVAVFTLIVALLLGTFNTTLVALIASGSLRIFTGGHHLANPLHCLVLTVISLNIIGKLAVLLSLYATTTSVMIFIALVMGLALFFIIKNAPVETPNRPIREGRRPGLRQKGLKVWLFWCVVLVSLLLFADKPMSQYILAVGLGIANQTISISKIFK